MLLMPMVVVIGKTVFMAITLATAAKVVKMPMNRPVFLSGYHMLMRTMPAVVIMANATPSIMRLASSSG